MRGVQAFLVLSLVTACAPPPKVAGHSQTAPPPVPSPAPSAAAPTPPASVIVEAPPVPAAREDAPTTPVLAPEQDLGTAAGFALEAMSPTGSYFAYCQPARTAQPGTWDVTLDERGRPKTELRLTLAVGTERFDVDELLAKGPMGRFVVTLEGGAPWLRDTSLHKAFALGSLNIDLSHDALPDHRSVAFSTDGSELALLTQVGGADPVLNVLDLTAPDPLAAVRTVPLGHVSVWRVAAEGEVFVISTVTSSGKGPSWPVRSSNARALRCTQSTFDAFTRTSGPLRDPSIAHALLRRGQTTVDPAPGFVMAVGSGWVRREDDGRLLVVQGKQQRQLASSRCGGRILGVEPKSEWFLVACEEYRPVKGEAPKPSSKKKPPPAKTRFPVYLLKPGVVRDLDLEIMRSGVDVPPITGARFVTVRADAALLLVDLQKGRAELLETADRILLTTATDVLLTRGGRLVRWVDGKREELGPLGGLAPIVTSEAGALAVGTTMYVQSPGAWETKTLERPPLAIGPGFALVPAAEGSVSRWARGPVSVVPQN